MTTVTTWSLSYTDESVTERSAPNFMYFGVTSAQVGSRFQGLHQVLAVPTATENPTK